MSTQPNAFSDFYRITPVWLWPVLWLEIRWFIRWSDEMLALYGDVPCIVQVSRWGRLKVTLYAPDKATLAQDFGDVFREDRGLQNALDGEFSAIASNIRRRLRRQASMARHLKFAARRRFGAMGPCLRRGWRILGFADTS